MNDTGERKEERFDRIRGAAYDDQTCSIPIDDVKFLIERIGGITYGYAKDERQQAAMDPAELMQWFEIAKVLYERRVLIQKKGPAGILAVMFYARELTRGRPFPDSAFKAVSEPAHQAQNIIRQLAGFAGLKVELSIDRASNMLIGTIRGYLDHITVPDEMRRDVLAWLDENQGDYGADVAARIQAEMARFIPLRGRAERESVSTPQWLMIDDLVKCRAVPDTVRRRIAAFKKGKPDSPTKAVASAWIETLQYYKYLQVNQETEC